MRTWTDSANSRSERDITSRSDTPCSAKIQSQSGNPDDLRDRNYEALWGDITDIWAPSIASARELREKVREIDVNMSVLEVERFVLELVTGPQRFAPYRPFPIGPPPGPLRPVLHPLSGYPPTLEPSPGWPYWRICGIVVVAAAVCTFAVWTYRRRAKKAKGKKNNQEN
jgi:hypothetical protein